MIACARDSRASGEADLLERLRRRHGACTMACGLAKPTSSLACAMMRRAMMRGSTPA